MAVHAAQVAIQLQARRLRSSARDGEGHAEDGVRAKRALVGSSVGSDEGGIDRALVERVHADYRLGALLVHMVDGLDHALAQIAILIAVTQLNSLERASRSAGGNHRAAERAVVERHLDLDGGIAARIKHLATIDVQNLTHSAPLPKG